METILQPPTKTNPEIKIKEMELEVLKKFLGSERQKTQITCDERILIGVLDGFASHPYPISESICRKKNIPFSRDEFKFDFVEMFLEAFISYGIPLDRTGRKEEVSVLSSYFQAQQQQKDEGKEKISTKLMK